MKKRRIRLLIGGLMAAGMLSVSVPPAWAAEGDSEVTVRTADITEGMLAHYDFEEASGTSVPNKQSAAYTAALMGSNVSVAEDALFGRVLKFSEGTDAMSFT